MRLPPDEVPDGLGAEEYQRLGKIYGLMGRTDKMMDAMKKMRDVAAESDPQPETEEEARGVQVGKALADRFFRALVSGTGGKAGQDPEQLSDDFFANVEKNLEGLDLSEEELAQANQISAALKNIFQNLQEPDTPPRDVPQDLSARQYFDLGVKYKAAGWTEQARDSLNLAIELDHDGASGRSAAVFLATKIPRHPVPLVAEQLNVEGFNRMQRGDLEAAKELFASLIQEYPDFEWPYGNLGSLLVQQGDLSGAREILNKALEINANYVNGWLHLARASAVDSDFDGARECLVRAANADPNDTSIESLRVVIDEVESWNH
jgi:tetratricopeptide (TPR) repeat protein